MFIGGAGELLSLPSSLFSLFSSPLFSLLSLLSSLFSLLSALSSLFSPSRKVPEAPRSPPPNGKFPLGSRTCLSQAGTRSEWEFLDCLFRQFCKTKQAPRAHWSGCSRSLQKAVAMVQECSPNALSSVKTVLCGKAIGTHLEHTWNILFFHVPSLGTHWNTLGTHLEHTTFIVNTSHLGLLPDRLLYYY